MTYRNIAEMDRRTGRTGGGDDKVKIRMRMKNGRFKGIRGAHMAEDGDSQGDPEANEGVQEPPDPFQQPAEDEEEEGLEQGSEQTEETLDDDEDNGLKLSEAYAAGWKARAKTAEQRKSRGFTKKGPTQGNSSSPGTGGPTPAA